MLRLFVSCCVILSSLAGCVTPAHSDPEVVTIARGGCFGFCPVYQLEFGRDGAVDFTGIRHSAYLGVKKQHVSPTVAGEVFAALAPYRPTSPTAVFVCKVAASDQAEYRITWHGASAAESKSLSFDSGCRSSEAAKLLSILEAAPSRLGVGIEAQQHTRPGTSRG